MINSTLLPALMNAVETQLVALASFVKDVDFMLPGVSLTRKIGSNKYYKIEVLYLTDAMAQFAAGILVGDGPIATFVSLAKLRCSTSYVRCENPSTQVVGFPLEESQIIASGNCVTGSRKRLFL
jgi:hypothetical protein